METTTRIAAVQLGPASDEPRDTLDRIVHLLEQAVERGVQLVCLPELALTPYFCTRVLDELEVASYLTTRPPTPQTEPIFAVARDAGLVVVLPFAEQARSGRYNSAMVVDSTGSTVGVYRKMHIPGAHKPSGDAPQNLERRYFDQGDLGFPVFDTSVGRVGVLICADRSFPEAWRVLGVRGAEVVCIPYNTSVLVPNRTQTGEEGDPVVELRKMKTLQMAASASFNHYYVVGAGKAGDEWGVEYVGGSSIISPWGEVMVSVQDQEDILVVADVDMSLPNQLRTRRRLFERRRVDHYGPLLEPATDQPTPPVRGHQPSTMSRPRITSSAPVDLIS